jgi:hypothetical protein
LVSSFARAPPQPTRWVQLSGLLNQPLLLARPQQSKPTLLTDSGVIGDGITNVAKPEIGLSDLISGATVVVSAVSPAGTVVTCTFEASPTASNCELPSLADGNWAVSATQTVNGATSALSEALSIVIDTTPPAPRVLFAPSGKDEVTVRLLFSEPVDLDSASLAGFVIPGDWSLTSSTVSGSGSSSEVTLVLKSSSPEGPTDSFVLGLPAAIATDTAGNRSSPQDVTIRPSEVSASFTEAPAVFRNTAIVKLEFGSDVTGLALGDLEFVDPTMGCQLRNLSGTTSSYQVEIFGCTELAGDVQLRLKQGAASHSYSYTESQTTTDDSDPDNPVTSTVEVDKAVTTLSPSSDVLSPVMKLDAESPTAQLLLTQQSEDGTQFTLNLKFDEPVAGFTAADILLSGNLGTGVVISEPIWNPFTSTYSVAVSAPNAKKGNVTVAMKSSVTDLMGNPANASVASGTFYLSTDALPIYDPGPGAASGQAGGLIAPEFTLDSLGGGIAGVKITLKEGEAEDRFVVGSLPAGVTATLSSDGQTLLLEGSLALSDQTWQSAVRAIRFETTSTEQGIRTIQYQLGLEPGYNYEAALTGPTAVLVKTQNHTVDLVGPRVAEVFATPGSYLRGDELLVNVRFDEPIFVSGAGPATIELADGLIAEYVSGSGSDTLVFRYVVKAADDIDRLTYVSKDSLLANGQSFADAAGNPANLTLPEPGAANALRATSVIALDGSILPMRISAPVPQTEEPIVRFTLSSTEEIDCTTVSAADFQTAFLSSAAGQFTVTPQGPSKVCTIDAAHTVPRASFGDASIRPAPGFSVKMADGSDAPNPQLVGNEVLVLIPAEPGKGEVVIDDTKLAIDRPTMLPRTFASGLLPNAGAGAAAALTQGAVISPRAETELPEVALLGKFDQADLANEVIAARKRQVIRAGDAVVTSIQVAPTVAVSYRVISYFNFTGDWFFGGEDEFDEDAQVVSAPLAFTLPGQYLVRKYVVPATAVAGVDYPVNAPVPTVVAASFSTSSFTVFSVLPLFVIQNTQALGLADLETINSQQSLELVLIIEPGDQIAIQPPPAPFSPPLLAPVAPETDGENSSGSPSPSRPGSESGSGASPAPTPTARPGAGSQAANGTDAGSDAASGAASDSSASDGSSQSSGDNSSTAGAGDDAQAAAGQQPSSTTQVTQLEPYDPFGSPEATRQTTGLLAALAALAAVAAVAAAAGAAGAGSASSASSSSGGMGAAEMNEDSLDALGIAEYELDVFRDEKDRWGDKLAMWAIPLMSLLDRPTHRFTRSSARFSPLVSKLMDDGAYLRAMLGSVSILPTLASIGLALWALQLNDDILLHPPIALFIAIMVIGLFDSFAGALGVLVFVLGSLPLLNPAEVTDWRMLAGIIVAGFGPVVLARSIRNFRRRAPRDNQAWLDRVGDIAFASLLGGWVAGLVLRALPALTGLAVPAAEYVFEVQTIATIAIALRIVLEELAARFYPARMDVLTPDTLPEPFRGQRTLVTVLRYFFYVFIASAFMGFGFVVWVAAALFMVPTLLGLFIDKLPRVKFLANWLPTGLPGLAMILGLEILLENSLAEALGDHPDFATIFVFGLLALIVVVSTLGMLARPQPGEQHWLAQPGRQTLYRVGGFVTFLLIVQFTSML